MKNKFSRYNFLFQMEGQWILYNVNSDGILLLDAELAGFVNKYHDNADVVEEMHKQLFDELKCQAMIVSVECDEAEQVIEQWRKSDNDYLSSG